MPGLRRFWKLSRNKTSVVDQSFYRPGINISSRFSRAYVDILSFAVALFEKSPSPAPDFNLNQRGSMFIDQSARSARGLSASGCTSL
jgi:hypothetical protein